MNVCALYLVFPSNHEVHYVFLRAQYVYLEVKLEFFQVLRFCFQEVIFMIVHTWHPLLFK